MTELGSGNIVDSALGRARRLRIVCPVYMDVDPFLKLRDGALEALANDPELSALDVRFCVLDDMAGRDPEMSRIRDLEDADVIEPPFNLGHQRGLVFALRSISRSLDDDDVIVTLDSDGEDQPKDIPKLVKEVLRTHTNDEEIVLAKRTKRAHAPLPFKVLYPCFKLFFLLATGTAVESGNFASYRARTAKRMLLHPSFALCYSSSMLNLDLPVNFVPCERGARYSGSSRMGYSKLVTHALRMLMPFSEAIARRTFFVFLFTIMMAGILAIAVLFIEVATNSAVPDWTSYALVGTGTISLVALGNLVILFTVYSQSTAISLSDLESDWFPPPSGPTDGSTLKR
ncbi:MAG: glycosyltransferase [Solirubrobacterales bacterium]